MSVQGYDPGTKIVVQIKLKGGMFDYPKYADDKSKYNPTSWFSGLAERNISVNVKQANQTGEKVKFEFMLDAKGSEVTTITPTLRIPAELVKDQNTDLVMNNAVEISIYGTDVYYMVRSGSFMQTDAGEGDARKCFDATPNLRKSSSPYNYAFYDLGMRLARSI
jgi:hypothetical protein